jgi:hypothetical protein
MTKRTPADDGRLKTTTSFKVGSDGMSLSRRWRRRLAPPTLQSADARKFSVLKSVSERETRHKNWASLSLVCPGWIADHKAAHPVALLRELS